MNCEIQLLASDREAITQAINEITRILEKSGIYYKENKRTRTIELLGNFKIYRERIIFDPTVFPDKTRRIVKILGDYRDKVQIDIRFL